MPLGGDAVDRDAHPAPRGDRPVFQTRSAIRIASAFRVRDTGTGMAEEVLRSAVEPFFTTKEPGKGSGLGLSQVYGMARQSNGAMQIESRLGGGTDRPSLPAASVRRCRAGDTTGARAGSSRNIGGRILVVDDDAAVREITVQMLRQAGFAVVEAESGQAALDALGRGRDLRSSVIDVAMPGLSGAETIRRARERWPALRTLYITGLRRCRRRRIPDTAPSRC